MALLLLVLAQLAVASPAPSTCAPSRTVTRAVRAHCDRTDGDWRSEHGCRIVWRALRTCDPALTVTWRRDHITVVVNRVDWWTMTLARDSPRWRVTAFHWDDCCECPADPWDDRRLPSP